MPLHYYKIVDGRKVEVQGPNEEITIMHSSDLDSKETSQEASLATISCVWQNQDEESNFWKDWNQ